MNEQDQANWDARYTQGNIPWDTGLPDPHLVRHCQGLAPCRVLVVGCGTGTNVVWLAQQGHTVTAFDISPAAVAAARELAQAAGVSCTLEVRDMISEPPAGSYDLVWDRGVFHIFADDALRAAFAASVAAVLAPGGRWLSLMGSTEGPPREMGPPRRNLRQIADAVEPVLALSRCEHTRFVVAGGGGAEGWLMLAEKRAQPAVSPSPRVN